MKDFPKSHGMQRFVLFLVLSGTIGLAIAKSPSTPEASQENAPKIALDKDGVYTSGKWKYVYTIINKGTKSEGQLGELYYNGKKVPDPKTTELNDYYQTPWGKLAWAGREEPDWGPHGWMLGGAMASQRKGKLLTPPIFAEKNKGQVMKLSELFGVSDNAIFFLENRQVAAKVKGPKSKTQWIFLQNKRLVPLPDLPTHKDAVVVAVSKDLSTIITGRRSSRRHFQKTIWKNEKKVFAVKWQISYTSSTSFDGPFALSSDGSTVIGNNDPACWVNGKPKALCPSKKKTDIVKLADISDEGFIIGWRYKYRPFIYKQDKIIPLKTPNSIPAMVSVISGDGRVIAGVCSKEGKTRVAIWKKGNYSELGSMGRLRRVTAISQNGSMIGGYADVEKVIKEEPRRTTLEKKAWIWTPQTGLVSLEAYLKKKGVKTEDWGFQSIHFISDDGRSIIGYGKYKGEYKKYLVVLPAQPPKPIRGPMKPKDGEAAKKE